jgi:regulator of protease activity HflC (stomatin/prohibitin superfamily)
MSNLKPYEIIIPQTHRGLWYQDGAYQRTLEPGRYELPHRSWYKFPFPWAQLPQVRVVQVDMRERDLTIKGQEILTADKVAIRVSIIVRFRVTDPVAAMQEVDSYADRIYTDVQLAARRSLASMNLESILTNRNELSEDILADVTESAAGYGVSVGRADVKDLIFPGNLQQIMNQVLSAERMAEAQVIQARAQAQVNRIEAETQAESDRLYAETQAESNRRLAESEAEAAQVKTDAEIRNLLEREKAATAYTEHPALLRLLELETLRDLSHTASARLYINFNGNGTGKDDDE